jgi:hypothetical protein
MDADHKLSIHATCLYMHMRATLTSIDRRLNAHGMHTHTCTHLIEVAAVAVKTKVERNQCRPAEPRGTQPRLLMKMEMELMRWSPTPLWPQHQRYGAVLVHERRPRRELHCWMQSGDGGQAAVVV